MVERVRTRLEALELYDAARRFYRAMDELEWLAVALDPDSMLLADPERFARKLEYVCEIGPAILWRVLDADADIDRLLGLGDTAGVAETPPTA